MSALIPNKMRVPYGFDKLEGISISLILNRVTRMIQLPVINVLTRMNGSTYCFNVLCFSMYTAWFCLVGKVKYFCFYIQLIKEKHLYQLIFIFLDRYWMIDNQRID